MIVTHNNHQYKVTPMANQSFWHLTRVDSPREGFTVNRDWLVNHGYWPMVEQARIDANNLRAAQNKAVIAAGIGDPDMWNGASMQLKRAIDASEQFHRFSKF